MTKNMGGVDRTIRLLIVLVIAALYFAHRLSGTLAIVLEVVALAFLVTSVIGWCPGYMPFGFTTRNQAPPAAGA